MPSFGMLIACLVDGVPDIGVISIPPTGERWTGQRGASSRLNGVPCSTSGQQSLSEAILYTTSPDSFDTAGLEQRAERKSIGPYHQAAAFVPAQQPH